MFRPRVAQVASVVRNDKETTLELDSHADTSVLGGGALVIADFNEPVNIQGYDPSLGTKTYRTITGAVGYCDPTNGSTYHLVIHQAISIPDLDHHLLSPMQCRVADVEVNDCPKFLTNNPTEDSHCIIAHDEHGARVVLPLILRGVTSALNVHNITEQDWIREAALCITLTDKDLHWNPNSSIFEEQESAISDSFTGLLTRFANGRKQTLIVNQVTASTTVDSINIYSDDNFGAVLESHAHITVAQLSHLPHDANVAEMHNSVNRYGTISSKKRKQVDGDTLARRWAIPTDKARATIRKTTQRGVRSTLHPTLSRRYPTNDRMMRYKRMPQPVFTDTLFSGCVSAAGMKCAQSHCTSFGWSRCYPMKSKGEAHETLSLMFKRDGIPPRMICDR